MCSDKSFLLILLGADKFLTEPMGSPHCIRTFINELLSRTSHQFKIIIVSGTKKLSGFKGTVEHETCVGPLSPVDAARLFFHLAPRPLKLAEFK